MKFRFKRTFGHLVKDPHAMRPGVSNRWKSMIGKPIDQSIKLVNWYRLVLTNRWSIDNHIKIVHRLASIGTGPRNRRHARYLLSDHPPFLGSPGDEIGKTIPTQTSQNIPCCTRTRITHLHVIAFPCHNVYARRTGRGFTEYTVHRQRLSYLPFWGERLCFKHD